MMSSQPTRTKVVLDFKCEGWRSGIPVLFLHGYTDSRRSYDPVLAQLPDFLNAIAVSQRGHGDSDRPDEGYSPSDFASDILHLMDSLNIQRTVIVGHSMGASVAQRFAIDHPERTVGLVLVGSFYTMHDHPAVLDLWESTVSHLVDPIDPAIVQSFQESTIAHSIPKAFLDLVVQESLKVPAKVWKETLRNALDVDFSDDLSKITVPTQLIWGNQDAIANRLEQTALLAAIPGSKLKIYGGIGHAPHWEEPARFVNDVVDFIWSL
jgi:non-heme chloroperoxidase